MLLAKLAGAMKGNLSKAAALFQAPLSKAARLAAALQDKREKDGRRGGLRPPRRTTFLLNRIRKGRQTWRSSAPTSCSTRSRR